MVGAQVVGGSVGWGMCLIWNCNFMFDINV